MDPNSLILKQNFLIKSGVIVFVCTYFNILNIFSKYFLLQGPPRPPSGYGGAGGYPGGYPGYPGAPGYPPGDRGPAPPGQRPGYPPQVSIN